MIEDLALQQSNYRGLDKISIFFFYGSAFLIFCHKENTASMDQICVWFLPTDLNESLQICPGTTTGQVMLSVLLIHCKCC